MTAPRYVLARRPGMQLDVFATRCGLHPDIVRRLVALGLVRCHVDARGRPGTQLRGDRAGARPAGPHRRAAIRVSPKEDIIVDINKLTQKSQEALAEAQSIAT